MILVFMKGGIIIPIYDFIMSSLGLVPEDIDSLVSSTRNNDTHFTITLKRKQQDCPFCGGYCISHGFKTSTIHHPLLIDYDGFIHWHAHRFKCKECLKTFTEPSRFSFPGQLNSFSQLSRIMKALASLDLSYSRIAQLYHISTTSVISYMDSYVTIPTKRSLPEIIGIDELHSNAMSASNSSYLCILVDHENRCPFEILNSRSKASLIRFFDRYTLEERSLVRYVTIDMWEPYQDVVHMKLPNAIVAVDPFHVVKHLCDAFTKLRISIMNQTVYGSNAYYLLKTWHKLLMNTDIDLDNTPQYNGHFKRKLNYRQLQEMTLSISDTLLDAFNLKEQFRFFIQDASIEDCEVRFTNLMELFQSANIPQYQAFIEMCFRWKSGILTSFIRPLDKRKLSNSLCENINGKLRTYLSLSNGVSNFTRFRKRVLYALDPHIFYAITDHLRTDKNNGKKRGSYKQK